MPLEAPSDVERAARRGVRSAVVLLVVMALSVLALSQVSFTADAVADLRARTRPGWLAVALVVMTVGLVFLALRWRALLGVPAPLVPLTAILMVGSLLNYALPGPVGEFAAAWLAARRFGISAELAFAAGAQGRLIGLAVAGAASVLLLAVHPLALPPGAGRWVGIAAGVVAGGTGALALLSAHPTVLRRLAAVTVGRVPALAGLTRSVERLADALATVGALGWRRYLAAVGWALAGHGTVIAGIVATCAALGVAPDVVGVVFTYAMATAGAIVLYAFPGSQVGWDAMFASLLVTTAGLATPDALAVTFVVRVHQVGVVLLGALVVGPLLRDGKAPVDG